MDAGDTHLSAADSLARVAEFLGALHGHVLTRDDRAELGQRLEFTISAEPQLEADYRVLARYLDAAARGTGASSFLAAQSAQRQRVIEALMREEQPSLVDRLWGHFSSSRKQHNRMHSQTVPQLAWLYRHSGVPWRARGYSRWPGVPGDRREVTRAGPPYP